MNLKKMFKPKKPNYQKWLNKKNVKWWEMLCLLCEIEPPTNFDSYLELKSRNQKVKNKEKEFEEKGLIPNAIQ